MPGRTHDTHHLVSLSRRRFHSEVMDDPTLARGRLRRALQGLDRINRLSGTVATFAGPVLKAARAMAPVPLRLLDIATGSGRLPLELHRKALRAGLEIRSDGCDINESCLEMAREAADRINAPSQFFLLDALTAPLPDGYDIITCSLFLHHVPTEQASPLLARMAAASRRLLIVDDLLRSRAAWWLAVLGTRLLSRCDVVHADGPSSVEGAFTLGEARALAQDAGLNGFELRRRFPMRFVLSWRRP